MGRLTTVLKSKQGSGKRHILSYSWNQHLGQWDGWEQIHHAGQKQHRERLSRTSILVKLQGAEVM